MPMTIALSALPCAPVADTFGHTQSRVTQSQQGTHPFVQWSKVQTERSISTGRAAVPLRRCSGSAFMRALGLLLDTRSGQLLTLSARTLVGRSEACLVAINDPRVSAEHAAIAWSGDRWELRDLGSLNGTVVDGRRLAAGDRTPITRDARLVFG